MNQYAGKVLFSEKLAKAKEALKNTNMREIVEKYQEGREVTADKETSDTI